MPRNSLITEAMVEAAADVIRANRPGFLEQWGDDWASEVARQALEAALDAGDTANNEYD